MEEETTLPRMNLRRRLSPEEKEAEAKRLKLEEEVVKKEVKRRELRPFIKYQGKLVYHTEIIDAAIICESLLEKAKKSDKVMAIGFDLEWPFNYTTGPERTAVIQISPDLKTCYVLQVSKMKSLPKSLSEFLVHPNIRIIGNNIKNDVRKLARDFVGFDVEKMIENCIDLGVMANTILPMKQRWSLEKLVSELASLLLYNTLLEKEKQISTKEDDKNLINQ